MIKLLTNYNAVDCDQPWSKEVSKEKRMKQNQNCIDCVDTYTSFGQIIDDAISRCPEREAIIFEGERITYGQLGQFVNQTSRYMQRIGIRKGSMVAVISRNCPEFIITEFALYRLGAVAVKLNWRLTPAEMAYILELNNVTHAFFQPEKDAWGKELLETFDSRVCFTLMNSWDGRPGLRECIAGEDGSPVEVAAQREDTACHLHTSGTTGYPKCVVHTHGGMLGELKSALKSYHYPDGQRYQYIAQLFHSAAIGAHLSLATGGTMILKSRFVLDDYMKTLTEERVNAISVIPTILKWILDEFDQKRYDLSALNTINYSTCPIPPVLLERAISRLHCKFYQSYGMTEMNSIVTCLSPEDHEIDGGAHLTSVGRPIEGAEVKIVDNDGRECGTNEPGEIWVKGPGCMKGYFKRPDLNKEVFVDGWYRTKDVGYLDSYGYLNLCGRADDLIISGGENIYPGEILNIIMQLNNDIAEAAVYGVEDAVWGEHVKASIVRMPGSTITEDDIIQYCRANMPSYRVPKEVEFLSELPKNSTGKVLLTELRKKRA